MRYAIFGGLVAATLGATLMAASVIPASAQVARPLSALATGDSSGDLVTLVQARRSGGAVGARASRAGTVRVARAEHRRWTNHPRRWNNWRWRHRHAYWGRGYWPYWGSGFAVGIGLGAPYYAYSPGYYVGDDAVAYCLSRFRSYDPVSGTYLGYDGRRHPCP